MISVMISVMISDMIVGVICDMKTDLIPYAVARAVTINRRAIAHTKYRL